MRRRAHDIVREALRDTLGNKAQAMCSGWYGPALFTPSVTACLRHYARHLQLEPSFTVIDRGDSADLLDELRTQLGLAAKEQRFPRKGCVPRHLFLARQHAEQPAPYPGAAVSVVQGLGGGPHALFAATSSASSALRCSTTMTCCSTGT